MAKGQGSPKGMPLAKGITEWIKKFEEIHAR
jgi:hypothetical protein